MTASTKNPAVVAAGLSPLRAISRKAQEMVQTLHARDKVPALNLGSRLPPRDDLTVWLERGKRKRFSVECMVTPEMALRLLANNPENRSLSLPVVENYAAAMRRGEWRLNGINIIIAATGEVNDGQHRLQAVVSADEPVLLSLQFGIERDTRSTVDVGKKRTLGDHFAMAKVPNAMSVAAMVKWAWCYDNEFNFQSHPSVAQAFDYLEQNPGIEPAVNAVRPIINTYRLGTGPIGGASYVCSRLNEHVHGEFGARVGDGLGISSTSSPIYRVRERYQQHATKQKPMAADEAAAVYIKGFNAYLRRRNCRALSYVTYGEKAETFPRAGA